MVAKFFKIFKSFHYCRFYSITMATSFKPVRNVLIDLSGTLHVEHDVISGSVEALKKLRSANFKVKFVTNTTKESGKYLYDRLKSLGFEILQEEIYTSLHAARDLLRKENLKPMLMLEKSAWEDFPEFRDIKEQEINAVVIGYAPSEFNYEHLNKAFRLIMGGAKLVAIHEGRYFKQKDGLALGPGAFVKGLEYCTDKKAVVVGKPTPSFFKAALNEEDPHTAVMIGDDVRDDVEGAQKLGMRGFLVKTGKYLPGDEKKITPPPTEVCENFSEAVEKILAMARPAVPQ